MLILCAVSIRRFRTDEYDAVVRDSEIICKVMKESLIVTGYRVSDGYCEVAQGSEKGWIITFRFEVDRW